MKLWLLIAKALGTMRAELQASAIRTEVRDFEYSTGMESAPLSTLSFETGTETLQLHHCHAWHHMPVLKGVLAAILSHMIASFPPLSVMSRKAHVN